MGWFYSSWQYHNQADFVQGEIVNDMERSAQSKGGVDFVHLVHKKGIVFLGYVFKGRKYLDVFLIDRQVVGRGADKTIEWGYKPMNIDAGPADTRCPDKVLKWYQEDNPHLSENALRYIARCREARLAEKSQKVQAMALRDLPLGTRVGIAGSSEVYVLERHYFSGLPRGQCLVKELEPTGKTWRASYKDLVVLADDVSVTAINEQLHLI